MEQENKLVAVITQSGLDTTKSDILLSNFVGFYQEAKQIVEEARVLVVTDESQKDEMAKAHELRMKLRDIRTKGVEDTRIKLKEQSLREGKAIDGISNLIKALIVPAEEYLEKQEKFAEIKEAERKAKVYAERVEKLSKYVTDVTLYNIRDMADEVFDNLLAGCKANWEKAREDEAKAEAERLAKLEAERQEQERIRLENEKLRKEAEEREKALAIERAKQAKLNEEKEKALAVERAKQAEEIRKLNEEKEKAEAKLRAEKEAQAKKEAEEKAAADAKLKAEEEAKRKALLAPDKEKLMGFAITLRSITAPSVQSRDADLILDKVMGKLVLIADELYEGAKKL